GMDEMERTRSRGGDRGVGLDGQGDQAETQQAGPTGPARGNALLWRRPCLMGNGPRRRLGHGIGGNRNERRGQDRGRLSIHGSVHGKSPWQVNSGWSGDGWRCSIQGSPQGARRPLGDGLSQALWKANLPRWVLVKRASLPWAWI